MSIFTLENPNSPKHQNPFPSMFNCTIPGVQVYHGLLLRISCLVSYTIPGVFLFLIHDVSLVIMIWLLMLFSLVNILVACHLPTPCLCTSYMLTSYFHYCYRQGILEATISESKNLFFSHTPSVWSLKTPFLWPSMAVLPPVKTVQVMLSAITGVPLVYSSMVSWRIYFVVQEWATFSSKISDYFFNDFMKSRFKFGEQPGLIHTSIQLWRIFHYLGPIMEGRAT